SIDDSGQISFAAYAGTDLDSNRGIWSGQLNQISLVALPGAPAPNGLTYTSVLLNDVEQGGPLAYAAAVSTSGGGTQSGNWIYLPGGAQFVVNPTLAVPGEPANAHFTAAPSLAVTPDGNYAFFSQLATDTGTHGGIWANLNGTLTLIGHDGMQVSGFSNGVTWKSIFSYPTVSPLGEALFYGSLSNNQAGLFASNGTTTTAIALSSQPVPGLTGTSFGQVANQQLHPNATGDVAFSDGSIWLLNSSGYHREAQAGSPVIGGGTLTSVADDVHLTNDDRVTFTGEQAGNIYGIYQAAADGIHVIARDGTAAPGQAAGTTFEQIYPAQVNSLGQVAFLADLTLPSGSISYGNIFATEPDGTLTFVAGQGTTVTLPGRPTPYTAVSAGLYDFTDVELPQFDDQGDLVFTLGSAIAGSGTNVVMVAHLVPEPTSFVLAILAFGNIVIVLRQRSRNQPPGGAECRIAWPAVQRS
ncbi:MAG TPA: choice-of-anchor tandem repeat NxxGxxAF-containing protein, partial [Pirellulales bacterium]|nr:choice-of-anchor tandem repeat NxxGxxAF-containing protein [Pirellulales bacterium]